MHFQNALKLYREVNFSMGAAYAMGNIGLVHAQEGNDVKAEEMISKAADILEAIGDRYPIAVYNTYMADIFKERGEMKIALNYAAKSYQIAREEGLKAQLRDASLKLSELYKIQSDFENAFRYQSEYIAYRDSINNEATIRQMADLRTEYEVSKKQIEVDLLNQQAATQRFIVISLSIILALAIGLVYVIYTGYSLKIKSHRLLAAQKSAIKSQHDELNRLNKTKDRFFSILSHDLRGPVGTFQGISELIRILVDTNNVQELLKVSDELDKSSRHLGNLLDNLLYWAMSQQGEFPYRPEQVQLLELVNSTTGVLDRMASSKDISVNVQMKPDIYVYVDKNSILTLIRNLLNNAIKFTARGGSIYIRAKVHENMCVMDVEDEGVGMSQEKVSTIFDFKGKRSEWGTAGEKGIGLGLTLAYEFVLMNKGQINVTSLEGQGTTFTVQLPLSIT